MTRIKVTALVYLFTFLIFNSVARSSHAGVATRLTDDIIRRYQPTFDAFGGNGWDHANSVVLHGIEKNYLKLKQAAHLDYIRRYTDAFINEDGTVNGLRDSLDGMHPGVLCLFLYKETGEEKYLNAARTMRDHLLGSNGSKPAIPQTPEGGFWHKNMEKYRDVMSVDGAYMAYPFLLRYGLLTNDAEAIDAALSQTLLVSERSFDDAVGLPYHAWDFTRSRSWANPATGQSTQFWSRASGWYAMALVDMLEVLPTEHPQYKPLLSYFTKLSAGLVRWQDRDSGLWFQVVNQVGQPGNYPEMAGSGMMTYALAKGARLGLLDESAKKAADRGWQGMQANIRPYADGGLQVHSVAPGMGCQDNYEGYVAIRPVTVPSTDKKQHSHGYMAVLLAASEME